MSRPSKPIVPLTDEQRKLVEDNHNLIYAAIDHYGLNYLDYYDIFAIGLCKAALSYGKNQNLKFSTFAWYAMRGEMTNEFKRQKAKKRPNMIISLDENIDETTGLTISEVVQAVDMPENIAIEHEILRAIGTLTKKQREAVRLSLYGYSQTEIAEIFGASRGSVNELLRHARKKVMEAIA